MTETLPTLDLLVPGRGGEPERIGPDARERRLAELYAYPEPRSSQPGRALRANMVSSVDGGAWGPDHVSGSINDAADWRVFRVLRALADVVVVGAGTARAEGYTQLGVPTGLKHLRSAPLELALVSVSGRVPPVLAAAERPPFLITGAAGADAARGLLPADRIIVVGEVPPGLPPTRLDLTAGLDALASRGLRRMLCEGGPHLLETMLAADLVDELCVTTTPVLVGAGPGRIVAGFRPPGAASEPPRPLRLEHLLHAAGTTLTRWAVPLG